MKVFQVDLKAWFYLTNTASSSSGKIETVFWVTLFCGPRLLLCGPYYTVLSYCMIAINQQAEARLVALDIKVALDSEGCWLTYSTFCDKEYSLFESNLSNRFTQVVTPLESSDLYSLYCWSSTGGSLVPSRIQFIYSPTFHCGKTLSDCRICR